MAEKKDRTGEIRNNNQGVPMRIVNYVNNKNLTVRFPWGDERKTTYWCFSHGSVLAPAKEVEAWKRSQTTSHCRESADDVSKALVDTYGGGTNVAMATAIAIAVALLIGGIVCAVIGYML